MSLAVFFLSIGLTLAAPVRFVKFDDKTKEITVKEGKKGEEKEATYKITGDTKFFTGDKEIDAETAFKRFSGEKAVKGFDLDKDGDKAKTIKFYAPKKKKDPQ